MPQTRRRHYVEAAIRAFAEQGYHGTSVARAAQLAGVSQPRMSQVFGSKESLYLEALATALEGYRERIEIAARPHFDSRSVAVALEEISSQQPELLQIVFHSISASGEPGVKEVLFTAWHRLRVTLMEAGASEEDCTAHWSLWLQHAAGSLVCPEAEDEANAARIASVVGLAAGPV